VARWPERMEMEGWEDEIIKDFSITQELIRAIRNLRSEYKIEPSRKLHAIFVSTDQQILLESQKLVQW
jgi:valyl-tRNA synthetase